MSRNTQRPSEHPCDTTSLITEALPAEPVITVASTSTVLSSLASASEAQAAPANLKELCVGRRHGTEHAIRISQMWCTACSKGTRVSISQKYFNIWKQFLNADVSRITTSRVFWKPVCISSASDGAYRQCSVDGHAMERWSLQRNLFSSHVYRTSLPAEKQYLPKVIVLDAILQCL